MVAKKRRKIEVDPDMMSEEEWLSQGPVNKSVSLTWRIVGTLGGVAVVGAAVWIVLTSPIG